MVSTNQNDPQMIKIQGLLDRYLADRQTAMGSGNTYTSHLDEDSLSAFVEGSISARESTPLVSHLIDCSFCRHVTTELIRLDADMAESDLHAATPVSREPSRVSEVLSGILERMFGTGGPAVFAHSENDDVNEESEAENQKD